MVPLPEHQARGNIDRLLEAAGWHVCDADKANIHAARGVAIREFPLPGYGFADYLLYVDGKAAGVIEAKKEGVTVQTHARLVEIEKAIHKATAKHNEFLKELGKPLLPSAD